MFIKKRDLGSGAFNIEIAQKLALLFCLAAGTFSCTEMMDKDEDGGIGAVESVTNEIVYGTELNDEAARNSGVVFLEPVGCSGTLLNSRWVLTAAHCFADYKDQNGNLIDIDANNDGVVDDPTRISVRFGHTSDTKAAIRTPSKIVKHPNGLWHSNAMVDAALIKLSSDAPAISPTTGHFSNGRMLIYGDKDDKLKMIGGGMLMSIGYGKNEPVYGKPWNGVGTLRQGEVSVYNTDTYDVYVIGKNPPENGLHCNGDSGGPLFLDVKGNGGNIARYVAGIASFGNCQTIGGYTAASAFRDWVQSTVFGNASSINCGSGGCSSSPKPLPNSTYAYQSYVPLDAGSFTCYYVTATYNFEKNKDFLYIGNDRLSGSGTYKTHWCGTLPISLKTNLSVKSNGLSQLKASNYTYMRPWDDSHCAGAPNGWQGCRGTGCHACIELLKDYPKYFENHPNCIPNQTCDNQPATCSANCPAPTNNDR